MTLAWSLPFLCLAVLLVATLGIGVVKHVQQTKFNSCGYQYHEQRLVRPTSYNTVYQKLYCCFPATHVLEDARFYNLGKASGAKNAVFKVQDVGVVMLSEPCPYPVMTILTYDRAKATQFVSDLNSWLGYAFEFVPDPCAGDYPM